MFDSPFSATRDSPLLRCDGSSAGHAESPSSSASRAASSASGLGGTARLTATSPEDIRRGAAGVRVGRPEGEEARRGCGSPHVASGVLCGCVQRTDTSANHPRIGALLAGRGAASDAPVQHERTAGRDPIRVPPRSHASELQQLNPSCRSSNGGKRQSPELTAPPFSLGGAYHHHRHHCRRRARA